MVRVSYFRGEMKDEGGRTRGQAKARLEYRPHQGPPVESDEYTFIAPWVPSMENELSCYLERFPRWPWEVFRPRAQKVEAAMAPS